MIAILLSTFNGDKFLSQQIDSIINQTYKEWILYIRDDGSTDKTNDIIKHYTTRHNNIIKFIDSKNKLGSCHSFLTLLSSIKESYYMFCDQDDIWKKDKLEISINEMHKIENRFKNSKPIIIHSDLTIVNENLSIVFSSYWEKNCIIPQLNNPVRNEITGCTSIFNQALKELLFPVPKYILMHDYWIYLVSIFDQDVIRIAMNTQTILYRQHENNVIGAARLPYGKRILRIIFSFFRVLKNNYHQYKMINTAGHISIFSYMKLKTLNLFQ